MDTKRSLLTTAEAAQFLRLSPRTLERLRVQGTGPLFLKLGPGIRSRVLYDSVDLRSWIERRYSATSQYVGGGH